MIKAEVVFDESEIHINGYTLTERQDGTWNVSKDGGKYLFQDYQLEECIVYCIDKNPNK